MRVYCDTSVFGGVFDTEFSRASISFFEMVRGGSFEAVVSPVVDREIHDSDTPQEVVDEYERHLQYCTIADVTEQALALQSAYLKEKVLGPKWEDDGLHVALATTNQCDMIVSWNFKHIVNYRRIPLYNAVNTLLGYRTIQIYSPLEVIGDE